MKQIKKKHGWSLFAVMVICLVFGAPSMAKDNINFLLDWTIYGTHAPFFLAIEKGYYDQEDIDVKIVEGQGSATVVKLIAEGTKNPIGFADFGTMAKGVVQGVPVKAIFGICQTSPMIIISHAEDPIQDPAGLAGKIIAMAPAESTAQIFPALLSASGVDRKKVSVINPAVGAKNALFLQNRADALTAYVNVQVAQLEDQGAKLHYFRYADHGVNTLSNGICANTDYIAENGDLIKRFLRATAKGWKEAQAKPEVAVEAIFKSYPQYADKKHVLMRQLELSFGLLETPNTKGQPLGWMSEKDWQKTQEILSKYADLKKEIDIQQYFTNDYVPE